MKKDTFSCVILNLYNSKFVYTMENIYYFIMN